MIAVAGCAAQPPQPRAFDVFFEYDSAGLTPEAHGIVAQIASAAQSEQPSRIVVDGQATGTTPADARIARERSEAVARSLLSHSVDPSLIVEETTLVKPATGMAADRVAARKVRVALLPYTATASHLDGNRPQSAESRSSGSAPALEQRAER
jgi:hypothetical protein